MSNIKDFVKDRDEALLSLDKEKIIKFSKKYGIPYTTSNETVFWAGIHKAIIQLKSATNEQKLNSVNWLTEHGFKPTISNFVKES